MPELPEVEIIKQQMEGEVLGKKIKEVEVRDRSCFEGERESLVGEVIGKVERVGKWLFLGFESGRGVEVHLRMTGRLVISDDEKITNSKSQMTDKSKTPNYKNNKEIDYEKAKHTHVVIGFEDGGKIFYWDVRKFGGFKVLDRVDEVIGRLRERLGPEPIDIEAWEFLRELKSTDRKVKDVILDQEVLSGVGNIYANDALWLSKVLPTRKSSGLNLDEAKRMLGSIVKVMRRGLEQGGASDSTYRNFYGKKGRYQREFLVYGRDKGKCLRCGSELKKGKVSGRGTWWCGSCQR